MANIGWFTCALPNLLPLSGAIVGACLAAYYVSNLFWVMNPRIIVGVSVEGFLTWTIGGWSVGWITRHQLLAALRLSQCGRPGNSITAVDPTPSSKNSPQDGSLSSIHSSFLVGAVAW